MKTVDGAAAVLVLVSVVVSVSLFQTCSRPSLDTVAREYVELVESGAPMPERAESLRARIAELESSQRQRFLDDQLRALSFRRDLESRTMSFDEECLALYGVRAESPPEETGAHTRRKLEKLLGVGSAESLVKRYASLQEEFTVPAGRRQEVLRVALEEARRRSRERIELPAEETVVIRWVTGEPWPAFHSYLGEYRSEILVNEDFPLTLRSVVDIVTHEGYPGHHVASVLIDEHLVRANGWPEFSVVPDRTPQEFVLESLANYATELAFPRHERRRFEIEVLAPLAGLSGSGLETYLQVEELAAELAPFATEGARRYLDGELDRVGASVWLDKNALVVDQWAFLRFVDRYRTLVVTYSFGRGLARERFSGLEGDPWADFASFFRTPTLPKDLLDAT